MKRQISSALMFLLVMACLIALPAFAQSAARIVRLSDVEGKGQIDRHAGQGFENALLNLPVTQGSVLRTGSNGRAEAEFEDGSVVRLAPASEISFDQLSLNSSGDKVSAVSLSQGTAYFNLRHHDSDHFTVAFAGRQLPVTKSAHFRVDVTPDNVKLAVFKGELKLNSQGKQIKIKKGDELTLDRAGNGSSLAQQITPEPADSWDKDRTDYHERYYADSAYSSYPYYGRGDLDYYGSWYNVPGYGELWRPYNAGFGFDPFYDGYWCWYPGFGYTWVSGYPWGWLPYHYGSWTWIPGWGWGWLPGRYWGSWLTVPAVVNPPLGYVVPRLPPATPRHPTIIGGRRVLSPGSGLVAGTPSAPPSAPIAAPPHIAPSAPRPTRPPVVRIAPPHTMAVRPQPRMPSSGAREERAEPPSAEPPSMGAPPTMSAPPRARPFVAPQSLRSPGTRPDDNLGSQPHGFGGYVGRGYPSGGWAGAHSFTAGHDRGR